MIFAYADPPYYGCGAKHYSKHHANAADCDTLDWHRDLIERLSKEYLDGWALSLTSGNLHDILPLCPKDCRIMAWVKPFASFKPGVNPAYAWEPVIVRGGRRRTREQQTIRDWVAANITLKKGLTGAKPKEFSDWLFQVLNVQPGDELVDVFPGSGAVSHAWLLS